MRLLSQLSRLRWKLVLSYVMVTLVTVAVLVLTLIAGADWLNSRGMSEVIGRSSIEANRSAAVQLVAPLTSGSPAALQETLKTASAIVLQFNIQEGDDGDTLEQLNQGDSQIGPLARVVVDIEGNVAASTFPERYPTGRAFSEPDFPDAKQLVQRTISEGVEVIEFREDEGFVVTAVPIVDNSGTTLGALYNRQPMMLQAPEGYFRRYGGTIVSVTLLVLLPFTIILGTLFGFITAGPFSRRLHNLSAASSALAQGDLSQRVNDDANDEIGELSRQFNLMADQLEQDTNELRELAERNARLAEETQRLAALEERHHLARELHDGVKQQLFGMNLATSAALNLINSDPDAAARKITEIKELSRQAQLEMQHLLEELRPPGFDSRGLAVAAQEYLHDWGQRNGIASRLDVVGEERIPMTHSQALYRIVQEALANVARHAEASQVSAKINFEDEFTRLEIIDDGKGFDATSIDADVSTGLRGMRERLARLNGSLDVNTTQGEGTTIVAQLPVDQEKTDG